jgi:DNA-directed RNA polymerase beta' subunit
MQSLIKKRQPKSSQTKLAAVLPVPDFIPTIAPRVIAAVSALPPPLSESNGNVSRLDGVRAAEEFRQSAHKLEIESIEFSFFSTERIRQLSVVECRDSRTEGNNSVNSPNMGTNSRFESCGTCGLTDIDCPGHLGRIELATPIIHPLAIDYAILVLQSICSSCGRLLLPECRRNDPSLLRLPTAMRLREIARLVSSSNTITCPYNLELAARRSNPIEGMEEFEDQDKVFLETYTQLKEAIPLLIGEIAHEQAESLLAASSAENARNRNSPTARKNRETAKKRSDKVVSLNNSLNEIVREVDEKKSNWLNVLEKPLNVLEITYDISNLRATVVNLERLIEIINKLLSSPDSDQILKPVLQDTLDSTNKTLVEMKTLLIEAESAPIRNHFCPPTIPKYSTPKDSDALQIFAVSKSLVTKQLIRRIVSPESAKTLFNAIPIADLAVLGFNGDSHPRNFIMEMLPVIPERNRPPAERDGEFKPDHITVCYQIIIRDNCRLKNMLEKRDRDRKEGLVTSENEISTATRTLAFCISRLFNNSDSKLKIRHNEAAVTFGSRLTGKEGFCRAYAQGKRANFSGRSVIGPGIVPFGGLIIPGAMRVLTVPEKVHALNFLQIRKAAEAGRIIHHTPGPGQPKAGTRTRYTKARQAAIALGLPPPTLEIGDLVERLGSTGDEVFVNRQPTLHRHSIIGCRAIHHSAKKTIQMHMAYTKGMNADFDGDEANINVPQTLESRAELRHLMGADRQIVTNASSRPIMGLVYNAPTSAYLLSSDAEEDDRAGFISNPITVADLREITSVLLNDDSRAKTLLERASKYGISPQSPRYMISLTFPSTFTYKRQYEHEDVDPQDLTKTITVQREITIIDGVFIKGILSK